LADLHAVSVYTGALPREQRYALASPFLSLAFCAEVPLQGTCTVCWMDGSHDG
jgi:hypothetical protein